MNKINKRITHVNDSNLKNGYINFRINFTDYILRMNVKHIFESLISDFENGLNSFLPEFHVRGRKSLILGTF